jgi:hypothetical protein
LSDYYILDEHKNVVPVDMDTWSKWYSKADRRVAHDHVNEYRVSTVFLGLDHNFGMQPRTPLIFETMVFSPDTRQERFARRYSTWDEAVAGHAEAIRWATPILHPIFNVLVSNLPDTKRDLMYVLVHAERPLYMSYDQRSFKWSNHRRFAKTYTHDEVVAALDGSDMIVDEGRWMPIGERFYLKEENDVAP